MNRHHSYCHILWLNVCSALFYVPTNVNADTAVLEKRSLAQIGEFDVLQAEVFLLFVCWVILGRGREWWTAG